MKKAILWLVPCTLLLMSIVFACQKEKAPEAAGTSKAPVITERGPSCTDITIVNGANLVGICGLPVTGGGYSFCSLCTGPTLFRDDLVVTSPQTFTLSGGSFYVGNLTGNSVTIDIYFNCTGVPTQITIPPYSKVHCNVAVDAHGCCYPDPFPC